MEYEIMNIRKSRNVETWKGHALRNDSEPSNILYINFRSNRKAKSKSTTLSAQPEGSSILINANQKVVRFQFFHPEVLLDLNNFQPEVSES